MRHPSSYSWPIRYLLSLLVFLGSFIWRLLNLLRRYYWRYFKQPLLVGIPVVSVGNLAFGGRGKTPFVIALTNHLIAQQCRVLVVSRGYKRKSKSVCLVNAQTPVEISGDEPLLIAQKTNAMVVVGSNRYLAIKYALSQLEHPPDVILLDDAFSHLTLYRDINVVLLNRSDLKLTAWRRECLSSLKDAQIGLSFDDTSCVLANLRLGNGFASFRLERILLGAFQLKTGRFLPLSYLVQRSCVLMTALGSPDMLIKALKINSMQVLRTWLFQDHEPFAPCSVADMLEFCAQQSCLLILITTKDVVKIDSTSALWNCPFVYVLEESVALSSEFIKHFHALLNPLLHSSITLT